MADNQNATRNEIGTHRRGLSSDEIQELSKREMEDVTGGGGSHFLFGDGSVRSVTELSPGNFQLLRLSSAG